MGNWWLAALSRHAPVHVSHLVSFLAKHQITQLTQPRYSSDLVPCDFWLFPKLKPPLKGKRYQILDEIKENTTGQLMAIPTKNSAECFEQWKRCLENYVRPQGAHFEGNWCIIVLHTMFLYPVSSSVSVSIFHITWLDTFWTDLRHRSSDNQSLLKGPCHDQNPTTISLNSN